MRESLLLAALLGLYLAFQLTVTWANLGAPRISLTLIVILLIIIYDYVRRGSFLRRYDLRLRTGYVILGLGLWLLVQVLVSLSMLLARILLGSENQASFTNLMLKDPELHSNTYLVLRMLVFLKSSLGPLGALLMLTGFLVSVAFVEELLFRGIFLERLTELLGSEELANLVQAALFAGLHMLSWNLELLASSGLLRAAMLSYVVPLAILALALGYARIRVGSLVPEIVAHYFYDLFAILILLGSLSNPY